MTEPAFVPWDDVTPRDWVQMRWFERLVENRCSLAYCQHDPGERADGRRLH